MSYELCVGVGVVGVLSAKAPRVLGERVRNGRVLSPVLSVFAVNAQPHSLSRQKQKDRLTGRSSGSD